MFALLERLIFFLFLISAIRSALKFIARLWQGAGRSGPARPAFQHPFARRSAAAPGPGTTPEATMLHQDPVCGTYVAADTSLKRIFDGKVLHFCSAECRDRYHS
jgi:YHS domain-containing protein